MQRELPLQRERHAERPGRPGQLDLRGRDREPLLLPALPDSRPLDGLLLIPDSEPNSRAGLPDHLHTGLGDGFGDHEHAAAVTVRGLRGPARRRLQEHLRLAVQGGLRLRQQHNRQLHRLQCVHGAAPQLFDYLRTGRHPRHWAACGAQHSERVCRELGRRSVRL